MDIGWREYIKSRFRKASSFHAIGIELGLHELHISCLKQRKGQLRWARQHSMPLANWQTNLREFVEQNKLANTPCHFVLSAAKYQILQVENPLVEDNEILDALQWSVKEQLGTTEPIVIDYFDPPASNAAVKKLNVVACPEKDIIEIRDGILKAELNLISIGIEELALCGLWASSDDAILFLKQEKNGLLNLGIVKQQHLYFSRRLKGYESLHGLSEAELAMGIADNLSLEVQRSMDYFESQLRQAPVKKVLLAVDTPHPQALAKLINDNVFIAVEQLVPEVEHNGFTPTPACLVSLGAALHTPSGAV